MAPMAGLTTPAFRRSVRRWGAGLVFTEMISAYGVHYDNRRTLDYFAHGEDEHPLGFQLFGADADVLADAAGRAVAAGADLVDLNMACPVRKVVKTGAGAALLAEPERAAGIVAAVVAAVEDAAPGRGVPVTVKIRAGLRDGDGLGRLRGAAARRRRGRRRLHPPAHGGAALPRPRRPRGDVRPRRRAARPRHRLRRRGRPRGGARAARRRRRGRDARPRRRRRAVALRPGAGRGRAGARREARRGAPLRGGGHRRARRPRRRPPAPVLAQVPPPRRPRQAALAWSSCGRGTRPRSARCSASDGLSGAAAAPPVARASTALRLRLRNRRACPILARHFGARLTNGAALPR